MDPQDIADQSISGPQSIAERVINVHTVKSYQWVLDNVFSEAKCGKRSRILFWKSDKSSCHFFIEFASKDSVPIAQREAGSGVTVHCLSRNMNMFHVFDCLAKGIDPPKKRVITDAEGSQASDVPDPGRYPSTSFAAPLPKRERTYDSASDRGRSTSPKYRDAPYKPYKHNAKYPPNSRDVSQPRNHPPYNPKSKPSWNTTVDNRRYQGPYNNNYQKPRPRNNDYRRSSRSASPPRRPKEVSLHYGDRDDDSHSRDISPRRTFPYRRTSDASSRRLSDEYPRRPREPSFARPSDASIPLPDAYKPASRLSVPTQPRSTSDSFGLSDLEYLSDENIAAVIDTLKGSYSGPEVWMTVAAHYRRKQLHKNALAIVDSMLEVMRDRGMQKSDLRPALLLMAQCHYNIAKLERREPESLESSNRHFVLLLDWLRETYGPNTPALDAIAQSGLESPWSTEKQSMPILLQDPFDFSQRMSMATYDPSQPAPSLFDTHSSAQSRLDAVSEENERLREDQTATMTELSAARAALQEAEANARATETKLARALEDQRLANSRASRELDMRRRAEDRLVQERLAWERQTEELRDEGARAAVKDLNAILGMVARAPMPMLEATRVFCEARGRLERDAPGAP